MRRWHNNRYNYYLQLVVEGLPPLKVNKHTGELKHYPVNAIGGIDIGPSTIAATSTEGIVFLPLGDGVENIERDIARLQRKMDRQRRMANPQNYDSMGRIKRGKKLVWNNSRQYYKTKNQLKTLWHKRAAHLKQAHEILANEILDHVGNRFYVENMSMAGLTKRSKKNKKDKQTGRPRSKKRFGKSIANHAPSKLISILSWKAAAAGGVVIKIDAGVAKASQYNHISDTYQKTSLKERWKQLDEQNLVQRDVYSSFLLSNLANDGTVDKEHCDKTYLKFKAMHDDVIETLCRQKLAGKQFPSCMGL